MCVMFSLCVKRKQTVSMIAGIIAFTIRIFKYLKMYGNVGYICVCEFSLHILCLLNMYLYMYICKFKHMYKGKQ